MVMYLHPPEVEDDGFIEAVVQERQGGSNADFFNDIHAEWKARVQVYVGAKGNPAIVKPWPGVGPHKKKFQNLYLSPQKNSIQKPVLERLRSRALQLCPACGEDGTPNTLDHYLPKEIFPEFSITPANLFPMCDACQGEKSTKTVNADNERLFLHPYFDQFADEQVVVLEIGRPFESPTTIVIKPHSGLDEAQSLLISRHIHELDIARRYHRFFRDEYLHLLRLVHSSREKGQDVRRNLEMFREYALSKSANSWRHVFYAGVLADAELMSYLEIEELPLFL
jgi:hypothetical protein